MIKLTKEQTEKVINTIKTAVEGVRGTSNWYDYLMECNCYITRTSRFDGDTYSYWHFVGHCYPMYIKKNDDTIIYKKIRNKEYLYYGEDRYELTDKVKDLFKNESSK